MTLSKTLLIPTCQPRTLLVKKYNTVSATNQCSELINAEESLTQKEAILVLTAGSRFLRREAIAPYPTSHPFLSTEMKSPPSQASQVALRSVSAVAFERFSLFARTQKRSRAFERLSCW